MLRLISETSFGSKLVGIGGSILGEIKKLISKITTRGWAAIWIATQMAIAKASCFLYAKIKALYDAIAEEIKPFVQIDDVLSSSAKRVVKSGNFFVFENGDVSVDGKTIIKQNTITANCLDLCASDVELVLAFAEKIEVYTIGGDGTLTLARLFDDTFFGWDNGIRFGLPHKISYENGIWFFPCSNSVGAAGYKYTSNILTETNTDFIFISVGRRPTKIIYAYNKYFAIAPDGYWGWTYPTYYYASLPQNIITSYEGGGWMGENSGVECTDLKYYDNKICVVGRKDGNGYIGFIPEAASVSYNWSYTVTDVSADGFKKFNNIYYMLDTVNGVFAQTGSLASIPIVSALTGYDVAGLGNNTVITLNADDILWSGLGKKCSTTSFKIGSEILAGIGESTGITSATVNKTTYESIITDTDGRTFTFDGTDWYLGEDIIDLADYGITYEGTATTDDEIIISYYQATITYYELADGSTVCMPDQQTDLDKVFAEYGKHNFFVLDVENETIRPIRDNTNGYQYINVGGSYVEETTEVLS